MDEKDLIPELREIKMDKFALKSLLQATAFTVEETATAFKRYFAGNGNGLTKDDFMELHSDLRRAKVANSEIEKVVKSLESLSAEHSRLQGNE